MVLDALRQLRADIDPVIAYEGRNYADVRDWARAGWEVFPIVPDTPKAITRRLVVRMFGEASAVRIGAMMETASTRVGSQATGRRDLFASAPTLDAGRTRWLRRHGIDLMVYPVPTARSFESGVPYVMSVHDVQHRINPEFPEVSANGEWETREHLFSNGIRHADGVIVDSYTGRDYVLEFYGHLTASDRVHVLPYVLPPYLSRPSDEVMSNVLESLHVRGRYLLFPAQFWPHKNHRRVTDALAALHHQGVDAQVVMTGSASGEIREQVLADVREVVSREGIEDLVKILGFVDDASMAALYAGSSGVILPTFFGPTNIPVIEGWAMGVPVMTSDIRGIREQCGDAAILVDPLSVEAIADGLRRLWLDEQLRERLVVAGGERLRQGDPSGFRVGLERIISIVAPAAQARREVVA